MVSSRCLLIALLVGAVPALPAQSTKAGPVFVNGQAQVVPAFQDPTKWIHQELWVETDFDTDHDGKKDRVHVDVTRPAQTETEGLKVPVVMGSSPYYAGTGAPAGQLGREGRGRRAAAAAREDEQSAVQVAARHASPTHS